MPDLTQKLEPLWHVEVILVATIIMQLRLPTDLVRGPRLFIPMLELLLILGLRYTTPKKHIFESSSRRAVVVGLLCLLGLANATSLELLVRLILSGQTVSGAPLVMSGINIAITNVVVFGLWYWEMDGGGPGARRDEENKYMDFQFPQMSNPELSPPGWFPTFLDYFYVSGTNALAFSPTDTMPISRRAKLLMFAQSLISLSTIALVVARAVNILGK